MMLHALRKLPYKLNVLSRAMTTPPTTQKMEDYFPGKKIIVTGSSAGMGEKITSRLLELGACVYAIVEKEENLKSAIPNTKPIVCDVSDWEKTYKTMLEIGPVHGLVNNAGVAVIEPFFNVSQHGWD
ncbi:NAD(P)-binding domain,Short-chain dehydrogenase/reductase SDR, partial [Cinara cedri]